MSNIKKEIDSRLKVVNSNINKLFIQPARRILNNNNNNKNNENNNNNNENNDNNDTNNSNQGGTL